MKTLFKIIATLVVLVVVVFAGLSIFIHTLDANKYRPQIVKLLSDKTGRKVELNGPIAFSLNLGGVDISIQNASIGNPAWASRSDMAKMGTFEIGVGLLPLLSHDIEVKSLTIENADILLETNAAGLHNWTFGPAKEKAKEEKAAPSAKKSGSASASSLSVGNVHIMNSSLAMRGADGKTSSYKIKDLTLDTQGAGAVLAFTGDIDGTPLVVNAKTGITNLLDLSSFPFDATLTYGGLALTAQGKADPNASKADITSYTLSAGGSKITGHLSASWGGEKPFLRGEMQSDRLDPADFKSALASNNANAPSANASAPASSGPKRVFSSTPLPLAALKSANVDVGVSVGDLVVGKGDLKNVTAKLTLANGNLTLAPVKAMVGGKPVEAQLKLDASRSPAHLTLGVIGKGVDLGALQKLGGMSPFMSGQASANIQLEGQGDSTHAIASGLDGIVTITAEKGEIMGGAVSDISSALAAIFAPKGGDSAINCLAARFIAKNGILHDNGILVDSAASTVAGKGGVNLGAETVALVLHAKTKLVDIGGIVPPLTIGGTLAQPSYSVDAVGAVKNLVGNVLGNLENGNVDLAGNSGVPDIQTAPAGQNACVYTLDHPKAAPSSSILPANPVDRAGKTIKNIGNSLIKGIFGQ
ncbi:MAG: AsmA family protein [Alphaproteobacteria bacterium]|nr:AsmA family protein [Alphaproteobacteria bacterium]